MEFLFSIMNISITSAITIMNISITVAVTINSVTIIVDIIGPGYGVVCSCHSSSMCVVIFIIAVLKS
jgi:hypothetical protein